MAGSDGIGATAVGPHIAELVTVVSKIQAFSVCVGVFLGQCPANVAIFARVDADGQGFAEQDGAVFVIFSQKNLNGSDGVIPCADAETDGFHFFGGANAATPAAEGGAGVIPAWIAAGFAFLDEIVFLEFEQVFQTLHGAGSGSGLCVGFHTIQAICMTLR